ncbi:MAG: hypothetical protein JXA68_08225 [Ignavibacteriales bacterium]|nr:hypothetical protein [Ignavibacteriales bacterium]
MIGILNYDTKGAAQISEILKCLNSQSKIIFNEYDLLQCDKIILPDGEFLGLSIRKLQFTNLYNALKVIQKPMLGINLGMFLLCEEVVDYNLFGLCTFPMKIKRLKHFSNVDLFDCNCTIIHSQNTKLLSNIGEDEILKFYNKFFIESNEYTTSYILIDSLKIATSIRKDNVYGVQFRIENNNAGLQLLKNFIEI